MDVSNDSQVRNEYRASAVGEDVLILLHKSQLTYPIKTSRDIMKRYQLCGLLISDIYELPLQIR